MSIYHYFAIGLLLAGCQDTDNTHNIHSETTDSSMIQAHLNHLRSVSRIGQVDGIPNDPPFLVDYVINNCLEEPSHIQFLKDHRLLNPICLEDGKEESLVWSDTLTDGGLISMKVSIEDISNKGWRDFELEGRRFFGGRNGKNFSTYMKSIELALDGENIIVDQARIPILLEPNLWGENKWLKGFEVFEDGDYIFLYVRGGWAANVYFNASGFITAILVDYVPLSMYGAFYDEFVGF